MPGGFSFAAVSRNLRSVPVHLIQAMPMLILGLAGLAWIAGRRLLRRGNGTEGVASRRDFAVGLALAASWFGVWGLYTAYTWTTPPGLSALQTARFYVPAIGAISLLGAWLMVHLSRRPSLAVVTSAAVVMAMFGLGIWSYHDMLNSPL